MTKYGRWESINSLSGNQSDPENAEQLRWTKKEFEDKVTRILKLITKNNDQPVKEGNCEDKAKKELEVVELIEDLHKHYTLLYAFCDHLKEELRENVNGRKEKEVSSSSTSSSDSEYYSPEEVLNKNSKLNEHHKVVEGVKKKLETAYLEANDSNNKLTSTLQNEPLVLEYKAASSKNEEFERVIGDLKIEAEQKQNVIQALKEELTQLNEKFDEKERSIMSSAEMQKVRESEVSARIEELEGLISTLRHEVESLHAQRREKEEETENRKIEIDQLKEEHLRLQVRIRELHKISEEKGSKHSAALKKLKDHEKKSKSKTDELMAQTRDLQVEVDSLRTQKKKLEQIILKSEDASAQVGELMVQVEKERSIKNDHIKQMNEERVRRDEDGQRMLKEKEDLVLKVKGLDMKLTSLQNQKSKLEEQISLQSNENSQLREGKDRLHRRILELEKILNEKGDEASARLMSSTAQVARLQQELDSLQKEKSELELKFAREKQEFLESLNQARNENTQLSSKLEEQQRTLKEQEDNINQLSKQYEGVKNQIQKSKSDVQTSERKMGELAEEFCKNIEDSIRLLYQRIKVAEALHNENKQSYRVTKQKFEQENKLLKGKLSEYVGIITSTESAIKKTNNISKTANSMLTGLDSVLKKFEADSGNYSNRMLEVANQLQFAKNWVVGTNKVSEVLKEEVGNLNGQLELLQVQVKKEGEERLCLMKAVSQFEEKVKELEKLVKEKEEGMVSLAEEKREAIRQLCVWIDYHIGRYDHLKKLISKSKGRSQHGFLL